MDSINYIVEVIKSKISKNVSIGITDDLQGLDLDSLDVLEIHMELEEKFGVTIDVEEFIGCTNIEQINSLINPPNE